MLLAPNLMPILIQAPLFLFITCHKLGWIAHFPHFFWVSVSHSHLAPVDHLQLDPQLV